MREWNEHTEKRILIKSKFTLTWRILKTLFIVWLLYGIYGILIDILADKFHVTEKNAYYSKLVLEWHNPNIRASFHLLENKQLNLFGTNEFTFPLQKLVGSDEVLIGEAQVKKRFFSSHSFNKYNHPGRERLSDFSFSLPEHPITHEKLEGNANPNVWPTLEKLHEGTVGELAFSTTEFLTAEELVSRLKDFDLHIVWLPLYTGEYVHYSPSISSSSEKSLSLAGRIGLTGGSEYNDEYYETFRIRYITEEFLTESEKLMLTNMEHVLSKGESYYSKFLGLTNLKHQYNYISTEGFITYGAVVTGPVKELLKLKELDWVQGEQLGEVALWNWDQ